MPVTEGLQASEIGNLLIPSHLDASDGQFSEVMNRRLAGVAAEFFEGIADRERGVIICPGQQDGDMAPAVADLLRRNGVPESIIVRDTESVDPVTNVAHARRLLSGSRALGIVVPAASWRMYELIARRTLGMQRYSAGLAVNELPDGVGRVSAMDGLLSRFVSHGFNTLRPAENLEAAEHRVRTLRRLAQVAGLPGSQVYSSAINR